MLQTRSQAIQTKTPTHTRAGTHVCMCLRMTFVQANQTHQRKYQWNLTHWAESVQIYITMVITNFILMSLYDFLYIGNAFLFYSNLTFVNVRFILLTWLIVEILTKSMIHSARYFPTFPLLCAWLLRSYIATDIIKV